MIPDEAVQSFVRGERAEWFVPFERQPRSGYVLVEVHDAVIDGQPTTRAIFDHPNRSSFYGRIRDAVVVSAPFRVGNVVEQYIGYHHGGCPKVQYWDGGDDVRCTCFMAIQATITAVRAERDVIGEPVDPELDGSPLLGRWRWRIDAKGAAHE